jgi:regulator of ribonuclease activity A
MRATADLVDAYRNSGRIATCETQFRPYGGRIRFAGAIRTVRCYEDNALVKQALSEPGRGAVLVVDGGGSLRTALMGDVVAGLGVTNGWSGVVIHGAVRDVVALRELDLGIMALGSNPWPPGKQGLGHLEIPVRFGNATFAPGGWVYCDDDGVLVADGELA